MMAVRVEGRPLHARIIVHISVHTHSFTMHQNCLNPEICRNNYSGILKNRYGKIMEISGILFAWNAWSPVRNHTYLREQVVENPLLIECISYVKILYVHEIICSCCFISEVNI